MTSSLVGSEMCIRDSDCSLLCPGIGREGRREEKGKRERSIGREGKMGGCLLYTSDAADDM
eukprot:10978343-Prorocentrum_lima.AAC.1